MRGKRLHKTHPAFFLPELENVPVPAAPIAVPVIERWRMDRERAAPLIVKRTSRHEMRPAPPHRDAFVRQKIEEGQPLPDFLLVESLAHFARMAAMTAAKRFLRRIAPLPRNASM